mgnify:CR=1 FL=1
MKKEKCRGLDRYPGAESHKDDTSGMWYSIHCNVKWLFAFEGVVAGAY